MAFRKIHILKNTVGFEIISIIEILCNFNCSKNNLVKSTLCGCCMNKWLNILRLNCCFQKPILAVAAGETTARKTKREKSFKMKFSTKNPLGIKLWPNNNSSSSVKRLFSCIYNKPINVIVQLMRELFESCIKRLTCRFNTADKIYKHRLLRICECACVCVCVAHLRFCTCSFTLNYHSLGTTCRVTVVQVGAEQS